MSPDLVIILTAGLVATACGILGPFLVVRRVSLLSDAVSHAVLPGIVVSYLVFQSRSPLYTIVGATVFAVICVLAIDALKASQTIKSDAAIALVFPTLFALGVLGVHRYLANVHVDLDSTIYGEIAFAPFWQFQLAGVELPRSVVTMAIIAAVNLAFVVALWKELKLTSFDAAFAHVARFSPVTLSRVLLVFVAITAVSAFESVGAILVIALLIVPASAAYLLTDRLATMVVLSVVIGWLSAVAGHATAVSLDASIAGSMGLVAGICFCLALLFSPKYGLVTKAFRSKLRGYGRSA